MRDTSRLGTLGENGRHRLRPRRAGGPGGRRAEARKVRPIDLVLERAAKARKAGKGWLVSCPLPEHGKGNGDANPSVSVDEATDGTALIDCKAGCGTEAVVSGWGLQMRDLFPDDTTTRETNSSSTLRETTATVQPCTLDNYAEAKGLPVEFLQKQGLRDQKYQGEPAVRIAYRDEAGQESAVRFRIALSKTEGDDDRFRWRTGSKAGLYGLWRLEAIKELGYVVLVEGESDAQTLWYHGIPALGVPGAGTWKPEWATYLEGLEKIYAVVEPDGGGEAFRDKLAATPSIRDRLYLVDLAEHKDANGLHAADPDAFGDRFAAALEGSTPYAEFARAETETASRSAWAACEELAKIPNLLDRFARDFAALGVAGEARLGKVVYLAVTSRLLQKPVSVAVKGPSSGGKSYTVEQVLRFFPDSAYYALTAMSERALAYSEEPLSHRILAIFEASGMEGDMQTYLIRSLLSEGRIRYEVVEKTSEGMKPRLIEREGPTGLLVTTTAPRLHPENETRLLSLTVTDTQDQTRSVLAALAEENRRQGPDLEGWRALQGWLETQDNRVTVPYAARLASLVPPIAVRLRRDFGALLNLIRAHAILHRVTRGIDAGGRVIATAEDYARVREIVADLVSEGVESAVPPTVRETVEELRNLRADEDGPATVADLARALKLDKSAAWRRVRSAMDWGYIKNLEDRKGRPARLVLGESLPEDVEILPAPEKLVGESEGCTVAGVREGVNQNKVSGPAERAGNKEFSSTPSRNGATVQPLSRDLRPGGSATVEELKEWREGSDREVFSL